MDRARRAGPAAARNRGRRCPPPGPSLRSVRMVLSASRWASLACAVRITNSRTPAPSSQDSISSFMTRCNVRCRSAAPPGKGREIGVHAELDGGGPQHGEGGREIVGEALDDDRVAAERQVGTVLLGGAHRHDQRGPLAQQLADRDGSHLLHPPGASGLSHRPPWWLVSTLAAGVAAAEWLRRPSLAWVVVGALAATVACLVALAPGGWRHRGARRCARGADRWRSPSRSARLTAIETRWAGAARAAGRGRVRAAGRRPPRGPAPRRPTRPVGPRRAPRRSRRRAPACSSGWCRRGGAEMSVVLFDPEGDPWAWAGRHRLPPAAEGDSIGVAGRLDITWCSRRGATPPTGAPRWPAC